MKTYANIYYRARMQAAQREPLHASRERTASEIFVSCEALADYETGRTVPPCDVVEKMVARDGRITQDELPAAQTIRAKAVELRRIMEETIAAIDKATSGQTKD